MPGVLKSGIPAETLIPAPVKTTTFLNLFSFIPYINFSLVNYFKLNYSSYSLRSLTSSFSSSFSFFKLFFEIILFLSFNYYCISSLDFN